jgi:LemA protein
MSPATPLATLGLALGAAIAVLLWIVVVNSRLVRLRVAVDAAWAEVATQLQRRHDLVPILVETVRGHADHESEVLEAVATARSTALESERIGERVEAEDALGHALDRLFARAESYPDLRADERFRALSTELADTEGRIAFARGFANDRVARYREAIRSFPTRLIAGALGFTDRPSFVAEETAPWAPRLPVS